MASKLDQLLENIDPSRTIDVCARRADEVLDTFSPPEGIITDWGQFKECLADFHRHLEQHMLGLDDNAPVWRERNIDQAFKLLEDEYGPGGAKAAFEMARTGNEGGLYAVLKVIAGRMADRCADNEIGTRVAHYLNRLTVDERLEAAKEYVEKYGHLLPSEVIEGSAARIKANFAQVLQQHPRLIKRLRQAGRP